MITDGLLVSEVGDRICKITVDISTRIWYTIAVLLRNQQA